MDIAQKSDWKDRLRVYPDAQHVVVFPSKHTKSNSARAQSSSVRSADELYVIKVQADVPGIVVASGVEGGKLWLWVSYSPGCVERDCAYGYVASERGRFSLAKLPRASGYLPATVFREELENDKRMTLTRLMSLDEAHEIWYLAADQGVRTVDLQIVDQPHPKSSDPKVVRR